MKQKILTIVRVFCLTVPLGSQAQFHAGSTFVIKANTQIVVDSLTMLPSADLNLSGNELTISNIPIVSPSPPGSSIARVALFTNPFSYQGTIGLYYDNAELNGNAATLLHLVYHTGQGGYSSAGLSSASNNNNHVTASTGTQSITISKLTATNTGTVLPLRLLSFDAFKEHNSTLLKWVTANEKNIHHFEVEKSTDVIRFNTLSQQAAGKKVYHAIDDQPVNGWNYYRLKIVEEDDRFSYSHIAKVWFYEDNTSLTFFPNPVTHILNVRISATAAKNVSYSIASTDGKVVQQGIMEIISGDNHFTIDFSSLSGGNYLFTTDDGFVAKILKE